jgi:hypothetical protein
LENRIVPSGTPGTADAAAAIAEPIVSPTVCVATSDFAAIPDATGLSARGELPIADSGVVAATPATVLEKTSEVVSRPQPAQGEAADQTPAKPVAKSSAALLPSNTVALDGYGGGYGGGADLPPTTSGIPDVYVDEDAADVVIQLYDSFDDSEDGSYGLVYSIAGNTNSSLFDSVGIEGYGGLVLDFAPDAFGEATLTIRATDTANQSVETSFTVHVAPVNEPPVISGFTAILELGDLWTFEGTVTDVDDPVEGMVVNFGGVLASFNVTATVEADGTFSLTREFLGLQSGTASAQTQDPHGAYSNEACYVITV